ncbi:MAG: DNA repair protein RecN [Thermoanaerobaculia bacterium]
MLRRLSVRNLAIVEDLEMELGPGLTVITGETGAGKSILVDALSLVAGGRGSSDLVRSGTPRLSVTGEFDVDREAASVLSEAGLDHGDGDTVLVRRELAPDGRGKAYVEDAPASVRTLARLTASLLTIHGQNAERELAEAGSSLELLDAFADAGELRAEVEEASRGWVDGREALETLEASRRDRGARLDLLDYQIREIEAAAPVEGEEEQLQLERSRLLHADRIRRAGERALGALIEEEGSAADRLGEAARAFAELAGIDPAEEAHLEEAEELKRRVSDLAAAARDAARGIEEDPERLNAVESRLERLRQLQRKYAVSGGELASLCGRLRAEREELTHIEDALEKRQAEQDEARARYLAAAGRLSRKRRQAAPRFAAAVEKELRSLAMEKARFGVALEALEESPRRGGLETATFLFAPNPGEAEKPLERIASGGELSRLQLAVLSVSAGRGRRSQTLVFDEVDAGIGGRTAEVVGRKLRTLAQRDQVLCVTHVPQIAALADRHFRAEKEEKQGRTVARVRMLGAKERIEEIARMLAGEKVPETALRHARALLAEARQ